MIAGLQKSISEWLKRAAELGLTWLKRYCPESWQEGLEKIQAVHIGPMIQAGCELVNRYADTIIVMLVVYLLATSSLQGVLVMAILGLGLVLVINKLNGKECQEA